MQIAKKSTRETIYEALVDCYNLNQESVTPAQLIAITGFNKHMVNDQLEALIYEDETVIRLSRGYFQPVIKFPDTRPMSRTVLPGGLNKFEVGDESINLTPAESRMATALWGGGNAIHEAEAVQQNRALAAQQAVRIVKLTRAVEALEGKLRELTDNVPQLNLELQ